MVPVIREDLNMTKPDLERLAAPITGTIICRVLMGTFVDIVGPRIGLGMILLVTAPFCFAMPFVSTASGF